MAHLIDSHLSYGERIFLSRRRRGLTQEAAARAHRVSAGVYRRWEQEQGRIPADDRAPMPPTIESLRPITDAEVCTLARRRRDMTIVETAQAAGLSRAYVVQIERGQAPAKALVAYWTDVGDARA